MSVHTFTIEHYNFLTIIDRFSKYAQTLQHISTDIVDHFITFFSLLGLLKCTIVDKGTEFKNSLLTELLDLHKRKNFLFTLSATIQRRE